MNRLRLGWVLPALLVVGVLVDLACRLVPPEAVAFRAWEALTSRPSASGPFQASARFETETAYGDLASVANLPALRHLRPERFSTDAAGCRNGPVSGTPEILLVGDSFGAGCAVNDDEMLSVRLEQDLGRKVYNAAGFTPGLDEIRATLRRLGMTRGLVLFEHVERWGAPQKFEPARGLLDKPSQRRLGAWRDYSPLQVWCRRAHRRIEDDRILPNANAAEVLRGTLPSGETMLFLRFERRLKRTLDDADRAAAHWRGLADELKKDGFDLAVVLVPNKSTIYGPLTPEGADVAEGRAFLRRIEEKLNGLGVPAIDLSPALEKAAREGLAGRKWIYRLDDTHWTPEGHRVASAAVAALLRGAR